MMLHGRHLVDDYAWLRNKDKPEVLAHLEAENAHAAEAMKPTAALQKSLYDEMLARIKQDDSTPPFKEGGFTYYRRYEQGLQYPIHCRKRIGEDEELVVLDINELGKNEKFIQVRRMAVSDSGAELAYLVDTKGFRQYTLKTKDLRTNAPGTESIERVDYVEFAPDGKTLLYVTEDAVTKRANKLFRHALGEDPSKDVLVYEEKDEMFNLDLGRTLSKAFFVVTSYSKTTSEVRVIDAAKPTSEARLIAPREHGHEYYVDHRGDAFYIRTNAGGRNFRLVSAQVSHPERDHWKELIPHRDDVMLEGVTAFKDHLVAKEREGALSHFSIYDFATGKLTRVAQPEPVYEVSGDENHEFETSTLRFKFESPRTPASVIEYDVESQKRTVLKQTEVIGYDPSGYETKRILATARDGTKIPVSLVFKKGTSPDGTHPALLYGYGAYGLTSSLSFSSERVSLLDRGFVHAHAHIRGGGDMGKKWHDQGRMANKMNTFTDFIDVAEHLKKERWAKKDGLVIQGGSAGGLLMGAVINMRPELFDVVLAHVPFVDVINTMLDETLPLTVSEFEEWGNPKNKADFEVMIRYSPYDNVDKKAYPTMLVRTSYNDSQVMYWEPAKWVAKLRANKTDKNRLLFKIALDPAGHGGKSGRYDRLHDVAHDYAFMLRELGIAS